MKKVVVTGAGCISAIGNDVATFSKNLFAGVSGIRAITKFNTDHFPVKKAGEISNFFPSAAFHVLDPFIQYGLTAAAEAISGSGLQIDKLDPFRIGIAVSSSKGGMTTFERFSERLRKRPSALLGARVYANFLPNILAQWIARRWKIKGPAKPTVVACATGTYAIIEGTRMIEDDEVDVCIAGASDASITPLLLAGYRKMGVIASDEIQPFDIRRDGFFIGEGAGVVILENEEHARARKTKLLGRILSYAYGHESGDLISFPVDGDGLQNCLKRLVKLAGISPKDIHSFFLHGTATKNGDLYEVSQIKNAFGSASQQISMSAIKSMIGHTIGASGAISFVASLLSLRDQMAPPTIHLEKKDPECDLDFTPLHAKQKKISISGSVSMGLGGHIGAILVSK